MEHNTKIACTTQVFRTDLSELCLDCPIRNRIKDGLENSLIPEYSLKSEYFEMEELSNFFKSELDSAMKVMKNMRDYEHTNADEHTYRPNRVLAYIWNLERAKLVKKFREQRIILNSSEEGKSLKFSFINNFNSLTPNEVYDYFYSSLVEKGYLEENDLKEYLVSAFQVQKPPEVKLNFKSLERRKILKVFYGFYKTTSGKPHQQKERYVKLLGDYFLGFNTSALMSNFSR